MDLSKLTPAPWETGPDTEYDDGITKLIYASGYHVAGGADPANAEFIALARNAFDVMMRRGWWAEWRSLGGIRNHGFNGPIGWIACKRGNDRIMNVRNEMENDPLTALVEADKWYCEHVEATPASPATVSAPVPQSS